MVIDFFSQLIWLDVKVPLVGRSIDTLAREVVKLLTRHNIPHDKVIYSASDGRRAAALASALGALGADPRRVVSDTLALGPWVGDASSYSGVAKAKEGCGCCANLGAPVMAANR